MLGRGSSRKNSHVSKFSVAEHGGDIPQGNKGAVVGDLGGSLFGRRVGGLAEKKATMLGSWRGAGGYIGGS